MTLEMQYFHIVWGPHPPSPGGELHPHCTHRIVLPGFRVVPFWDLAWSFLMHCFSPALRGKDGPSSSQDSFPGLPPPCVSRALSFASCHASCHHHRHWLGGGVLEPALWAYMAPSPFPPKVCPPPLLLLPEATRKPALEVLEYIYCKWLL